MATKVDKILWKATRQARNGTSVFGDQSSFVRMVAAAEADLPPIPLIMALIRSRRAHDQSHKDELVA